MHRRAVAGSYSGPSEIPCCRMITIASLRPRGIHYDYDCHIRTVDLPYSTCSIQSIFISGTEPIEQW